MKKSTEDIIGLYTKIPDYDQVKHLKDSEFINTIEKLKEEFRQCRASLYDQELDSDVDLLCEKTSKIVQISSTTHCKNKNVNFSKSTLPLAISSCEIHQNSNKYGVNLGPLSKSKLTNSRPSKYSSTLLKKINFGLDNDCTLSSSDDDSDLSQSPPNYGALVNKWCSEPEIFKKSSEFIPPSNIEKRILSRMNTSSMNSLKDLDDEKEFEKKKTFRANPVPSHVHKPLFHQIMLKSKKRSQKVREQSKQKLLAQVKPFSFAKNVNFGVKRHHLNGNLRSNKSYSKSQNSQKVDDLNNTKAIKTCNKRLNRMNEPNMKTNQLFRAKPAPARSRALLSAIKLKEQQEYRDLKKRLRSEYLLRTASLPPSMEARDKTNNLVNSKVEGFFDKTFNKGVRNTNRLRKYSTDSDFEHEIMTDESYNNDLSYDEQKYNTSLKGTPPKINNLLQKSGSRSSRPFTPYGESRIFKSGVFESTANDNHASRLRLEATRRRIEERIKREEEDLMRSMKADQKRKKMRDAHIEAWRRACSYSSTQDIAMRRQLRMAASILENESFRQEKLSMLSRVRSAPLLLEGRKESETICRRHRCLDQEQLGTGRSNKSINISASSAIKPYCSRVNWTSILDGEKDGKSDTGAFAEGSMTNSDNESEKFDFDKEVDDKKDNEKLQVDEEYADDYEDELQESESEDSSAGDFLR